MQNTKNTRITRGVVIVIMLVIIDLSMQKIYNPAPDNIRYLSRMLIIFAGILAACILQSKEPGMGRRFGDIFSYGFRTTAVVAFLMALYTFIAIKWIYPPPSAAEMEAAVKAVEQQGNALHEEARQQVAQAAKNRWIIYVSISLFVSLIPGLLGSLAGAALTKKKP
jgi:hypothetical protein